MDITRLVLICFALMAAAYVGCFGAGAFISPRDAYYLELDACGRDAGKDPEEVRQCESMVNRKYERYWSEGKRYPTTYYPEHEFRR